MYIEPNTIIRILRGCPLDNTYEHTIYFSTTTAQTNYFIGLTKYTLERQSYQRVNKGKMRVSLQAEHLFDCNYLMFQNTSFGNKWFYAFIKSVEYINNVTSEIEFEVDVMQTWLCDYQLQDCYIERNHVTNDTPFRWRSPEPFTPNEYMIASVDDVWWGYIKEIFNAEPMITLVYTPLTDLEGELLPGHEPDVYAGVYSGLSYLSCPVSNHQTITQYIKLLDEMGKGNSIVGVYMTPFPVDNIAMQKDVTVPINFIKKTIDGGYTIKNNKLLQYPFVRVKLKTTDGVETELKPELIGDNGTLNARIYLIPSMPPSMVFVPSYANLFPNWDYAVQYTENPQCAWSSNLYLNWKAQEGITNTLNKIGGVANAVSSVTRWGVQAGAGGFAGLLGGIGSGVNSIFNASQPWISEIKAGMLPGKHGGTPNSGSINYALNKIGFEVWCYTMHPYDAQMFDDYLDKYGYAIDEVRTPNITGRPHWCYIKTREISIKGSVPADDMSKIKSIYNNGITFWKKGSEVGDYTLDNRLST